VDSTLGDQTTAGNLLLFEPEGMESESFFELSHVEPRLWQSYSSTSQVEAVRPLSLLNFS
jgi:hypothetical protein